LGSNRDRADAVAGLRMIPLLAPTIGEALRQKLADDILAGRYPPGTRLDEQKLADIYRVSRTPVREALKHLAATGLVEHRPHRGMVVTEVTAERLSLMFEAMAELEAACARHAALNMTPEDRAQLLDLHAFSLEVAERGDADRYDHLNREFHALILRGCRNTYLSEPAFLLRQRLTPFRRLQFRAPDRMRRSHDEHGLIAAAIAAGRADETQDHMRRHLHSASEAFAESETRAGPDGASPSSAP
jgi:DNA-binding GntR family transcriptional regulator